MILHVPFSFPYHCELMRLSPERPTRKGFTWAGRGFLFFSSSLLFIRMLFCFMLFIRHIYVAANEDKVFKTQLSDIVVMSLTLLSFN